MASKRKNIPSHYNYQRPVLSDVLPFEVPPSFGNSGYFDFLTRYNVRLEAKGEVTNVCWEYENDKIDVVISTIFKINTDRTKVPIPPNVTARKINGKVVKVRKWQLPAYAMWTKPFSFNISHKESEFRRLSVIHPRNQVAVADFYYRNNPTILYHCSISPFSIRRPAGIAKTVYFRDGVHQARIGFNQDTVEQWNKEYENLGSYFRYEKFSNIFKFYEHYRYHNAEKKFDNLRKLDISKCFDSIYTHTLPWAVLGVTAAKDNLKGTKRTFGGRFDQLLQEMNQGETNGIVIGPEFSRIFAEIILQDIDRKLAIELSDKEGLTHKVDFEIFRYVDDYFVFFNNDEIADLIEQQLSVLLKSVKLNLNSAKSDNYSKPIITNQTIAKNKIKRLFDEQFVFSLDEEDLPSIPGEPITRFSSSIHVNSFIVEYKTILSETNTSYKDILNYTFAGLERNTEDLFKAYSKATEDFREPKNLIKSLLAIMEFSFFIYSAAPRVNTSVRLTRIITCVVDEMNTLRIKSDLKQQVLKYVHDNIVRQLKKSRQGLFTKIETLYLILGLAKLGRNYEVDQDILAAYFGFHNEDGVYSSDKVLNHFSITVCLLFVRSRKRYSELKSAILESIFQLFDSREAYVNEDAEILMLYLDLQCCPYLSEDEKVKLGKYYSHSLDDLKLIWNASEFWFTDWKNFNLSLELDKKRAREVY